jgi:hypothetical protein
VLLGLFSNCINLVDLTLKHYEFDFDLNITCPTLCHLNIVDHRGRLPGVLHLDIFPLNLSMWRIYIFNCNCKLMPPDVFCGMEKLTKFCCVMSLYLYQSICPAWFVFRGCTFEFSIHIISSMLRRLNIIYFDNVPWKLDIDALNLTSLDYRGKVR